jgi:hypothetical protein
MDLSNPKALAERGERIYQEKYKSRYEFECPGKFVAIDVTTEKTYIADSPEEALEKARRDSPKAFFHLVKVGSAGAFKVSYSNNASLDWIFR